MCVSVAMALVGVDDKAEAGGALLLLGNGSLVSRPLGGVGSEWSYPLGPPLLLETTPSDVVDHHVSHPFVLEGAQLLYPSILPLGIKERLSIDQLGVYGPSLEVSGGVLTTKGVSLNITTLDISTGMPTTDTRNSVAVLRFNVDLRFEAGGRMWELRAGRVFCLDSAVLVALGGVCRTDGGSHREVVVVRCWKALVDRAERRAGVRAYLTPSIMGSSSSLYSTVGIVRGGALIGEITVDYPGVESVFLFEEGSVFALDSHTTEDCTDAGSCALISTSEYATSVGSPDNQQQIRLSYVLEAVGPHIDQMSSSELGDFVKWGRQVIKAGEIGAPPVISAIQVPPQLPALPAPTLTIATPEEIKDLLAVPSSPPISLTSLRVYAYLVMPVIVILAFWLGMDMRKTFQDGWEAGFGAGEQRRHSTLLTDGSDGIDSSQSNSSDLHPPPEESEDPELLSLHATPHEVRSSDSETDDNDSSTSSTSSSSKPPSTVIMSRAASFVNSMLPSLEMVSKGASVGAQPALFFQHYSVEKRIGSGVRGAVFCARQHVTGKLFGIKVVVLTSDGEQRAIDEARLHSTLDNSHVVRYFNCWVEELPFHQVTSMRMLPDVDSILGSSMYGDETEESQSMNNSYGHFPPAGSGNLHFSTWSDEGSSPTSGGPAGGFPMSSPRRSIASELSPPPSSRYPPRALRLLFMQMEFFEAGTLRDYLTYRAEAFLLPSVAGEPVATAAYYRYRNLSILLDLAAGLSYLRERKVIHRDIKPSNIFVSNEGPVSKHMGGMDVGTSVFGRMTKYELRRFFYVCPPPTFKIGDFGAAVDTLIHPAYTGKKSAWYQSAEAVPHDRNVATANGATTCFGTPPYASPDQVRGELVGFGSDVFSLGVIGVELLHEPFTTDHERLVVLQAAVAGDLPLSLRQDAPEECELLSKMLSQREHKRPQLMAVVSRLKGILASCPQLKEAEKAIREQENTIPAAEWPIRRVTPIVSNLHTPTTPAPE